MNIVSSALGSYEKIGNLQEADCVIGHSFGTMTDADSVNASLAGLVLRYAHERPIIVDRMLANAFSDDERRPDYIFEGQISTFTGGGAGTWGTLVDSLAYMKENNLRRPIMIAQACHIGRVTMQAAKLGMHPVIPAGLPKQFDRNSLQRATRSLMWWIPREIAGSMALRLTGKL